MTQRRYETCSTLLGKKDHVTYVYRDINEVTQKINERRVAFPRHCYKHKEETYPRHLDRPGYIFVDSLMEDEIL